MESYNSAVVAVVRVSALVFAVGGGSVFVAVIVDAVVIFSVLSNRAVQCFADIKYHAYISI